MIRNLKVLALGSVTAIALSAAASPAQANPATSHFTSNETGPITLTTTTDSHEVVAPNTTAKTSHQVMDIRKSDGTGTRSITCNDVEAENASIPDAVNGTTTEITATLTFIGECQFQGQEILVTKRACDFLFTANGDVHIQKDVGVEGGCKHGDNGITFNTIGCHVEIGEQTLSGVKYHTIETGGSKMITLEATNISFTYNATGATCNYGTTSNGLLTTGNTILTAEKTGTQSMVDIEWKTGA